MAVGQFPQTALDSDADVASGSAGAVAVDQLEELGSLLVSPGYGAVEPRQGFVNRGHVGFEVDALNGNLLNGTQERLGAPSLSLRSLQGQSLPWAESKGRGI